MNATEAAITVGMKVAVSNGQPKPPAHHKKKVSEWEDRNYIGRVAGIEDGTICVETMPANAGAFNVVFRKHYGPRSFENGIRLTPVEE